MKTTGIVMAVMLLLLSGCAAQTDGPASDQPMTVQAESPAPVEASEEALPHSEAAEPSAETDENGSTTETVVAKEEVISGTDDAGLEDTMRLLIGEAEVPVTWEENTSVEALRALCPLTIQMSMYGGFEQVGPIGQNIVRDDRQISTNYGDIVLYSGNQIVIFYGSNSWAYTMLGHIDLSQEEMSQLLSNGDVSITLEYQG